MKQSIERQIRNIKADYPDAVIVTDEYTGTKLDRPGWTKIYKAVKPGDVIVFDSVSRMSRDADEGFQVYEELFRRGVELIFLKEHHIDTATYKKAIDGQIQFAIKSGNVATDELISGIAEAINRYLLALAKEQIRLAFDQAEKEVEDLHQRTREGIETARLNGKQIGQVKGTKLTTKKSIKCKEIIQKHSKDFDGSLSDAEVMKLTGLARGTYYKYKREMHEQGELLPEEIMRQCHDQLWHANPKAFTFVVHHPEYEKTLAREYRRVYEASSDRKKWEMIDTLVDKILKHIQTNT